jgi:hypothetical protein
MLFEREVARAQVICTLLEVAIPIIQVPQCETRYRQVLKHLLRYHLPTVHIHLLIQLEDVRMRDSVKVITVEAFVDPLLNWRLRRSDCRKQLLLVFYKPSNLVAYLEIG